MRSTLPDRTGTAHDDPAAPAPGAGAGRPRRTAGRLGLVLAVVLAAGSLASAQIPAGEPTAGSAAAEAADQDAGSPVSPVAEPGAPLHTVHILEAASRSAARLAPARAVELTVDGSTSTLLTREETVAGLLDEVGVVLGPDDEVSVPLDAVPGADVVVTRVAFRDLGAVRELSYSTYEQADASLDKGRRVVVTQGRTGSESFVYRVRLVNGVEESRELQVHSVVPSVDEVVRVGTRVPPPPPAPRAAPAAPRAAAPSSPAPTGTYSGANPREIGRSMAAARGWGGSQFSCLERLWTKESNWNPYAMNRSSGAYGIPQSLPGSKMASAGSDWRTNPRTQIAWGLSYIAARYGTPCSAWAHSQAVNWY